MYEILFFGGEKGKKGKKKELEMDNLVALMQLNEFLHQGKKK